MKGKFVNGVAIKRFQIFCVSAVISGIIGCSNNPVNNNSSSTSNKLPFAVAKSTTVTRDTAAVSTTLINAQAQSINAFAVNMYKRLATGSTNLFFSPYSITAALAMASAGAAGATDTQMRAALSVTLQGDDFHAAMNGLDLSLMNYANQTSGITLRTVNDAWCQTGWDFEISYLDKISRYYGAGVNLLDFIGNPDVSAGIINNYISDQTNNKITNLIPPGAITIDTRLVLTNAIYFLGNWLHKFDSSATKATDFTLLNDSTVKVPLMKLGSDTAKIKLQYFQQTTYGGIGEYSDVVVVRVLELPYAGGRLAMTIMLPENFSSFESGLTLDQINGLIHGLDTAALPSIKIPRFTYTTSSFSIKNLLVALGMQNAFIDGAADFSGIDGQKDLVIDDVLHKAYVAVNENGTEAAAATAVIFSTTSVPTAPDPYFVANKPFIFIIRDKQTKTILFMGRILDPTKSSD